MKPLVKKLARCAIYTRKSTEHGLELEFNSLDAQREACEAYIKSQAGSGWQAVKQRYDDPAYSGGSLERPALQTLLKDIEQGRIDVVVVYKIDRLTRSLADFAKLVEAFDAKAISFVAVTQQFNTTTSMGRLTLNVLLSFAQFERELSSERVRDKVAASRKKGKWMGGTVPLGYQIKEKKLVVEPAEAEVARNLFKLYLEKKSIKNLITELNSTNNNIRQRINAKSRLGKVDRFTYGALAYLLKNRVYIGEAGHKGAWFPGEHKAIVDRSLFDQVQILLKNNSIRRKQKRKDNHALLAGILFDDKGNRLTPSYTTKSGVRYRFYVNSALLTGRSEKAGEVRRISAPVLEATVSQAIAGRLEDADVRSLNQVKILIERIVVKKGACRIFFKDTNNESSEVGSIVIPLETKDASSAISHLAQDNMSDSTDARLLRVISRAHRWLDLLSSGEFNSTQELAASIKMDHRSVSNGLRLAFLCPKVTKAIVENLPIRIPNLAKIQSELPLSWKEQRAFLNYSLIA